jgi:uncharacterized protein (DUF2236 family)
LVGGLRALLLQALHPDAMRLMKARSRFQDDPWIRLQHTAEYVATVAFGSTDEVDAAAAHVRAVHQRLGISDPGQLAWVHACEVDSFLVAARRCGVRLDERDVDRYVAEQGRSARLVDVPDELVPRTGAELEAYFEDIRPHLSLTREALEAARHVIAPQIPVPVQWHLPARLGWTTLSSLAIGMLPGWARRMYRLPPLPGTTIANTAGMRTLRLAVGALPERWREGPHYKAAKQRLAS